MLFHETDSTRDCQNSKLENHLKLKKRHTNRMSPSPKVGSFDWPSSIQGQAISRRNIKTADAETHKYHALLTIFGLGMLSLCFTLAKYEYLMNFKSLM